MLSHLKPKDPFPLGASEVDVTGNDSADEHPKVAASTVQVPAKVAQTCSYYYNSASQYLTEYLEN